MNIVQSHFSTTTIDTTSSVHSSPSEVEPAPLSGISSNYPDTTRSSMYATSFIDDEPMSALLGPGTATPRREPAGDVSEIEFEQTPPKGYPRRDDSLPTMLSSSTVSSTTASSLATSPSEYASTEDSWGGRTASVRFKYQHYRLPAHDQSSEVTLKRPSCEDGRSDQKPVENPFTLPKEPARQEQVSLPHSNNMQQLIDELSYLGNMIHK